MNNFYASVECMLNPSLRGKPVAVCGSVEERHGIVLAKNYPAKAFGVKTGDDAPVGKLLALFMALFASFCGVLILKKNRKKGNENKH